MRDQDDMELVLRVLPPEFRGRLVEAFNPRIATLAQMASDDPSTFAQVPDDLVSLVLGSCSDDTIARIAVTDPRESVHLLCRRLVGEVGPSVAVVQRAANLTAWTSDVAALLDDPDATPDDARELADRLRRIAPGSGYRNPAPDVWETARRVLGDLAHVAPEVRFPLLAEIFASAAPVATTHAASITQSCIEVGLWADLTGEELAEIASVVKQRCPMHVAFLIFQQAPLNEAGIRLIDAVAAGSDPMHLISTSGWTPFVECPEQATATDSLYARLAAQTDDWFAAHAWDMSPMLRLLCVPLTDAVPPPSLISVGSSRPHQMCSFAWALLALCDSPVRAAKILPFIADVSSAPNWINNGDNDDRDAAQAFQSLVFQAFSHLPADTTELMREQIAIGIVDMVAQLALEPSLQSPEWRDSVLGVVRRAARSAPHAVRSVLVAWWMWDEVFATPGLVLGLGDLERELDAQMVLRRFAASHLGGFSSGEFSLFFELFDDFAGSLMELAALAQALASPNGSPALALS